MQRVQQRDSLTTSEDRRDRESFFLRRHRLLVSTSDILIKIARRGQFFHLPLLVLRYSYNWPLSNPIPSENIAGVPNNCPGGLSFEGG